MDQPQPHGEIQRLFHAALALGDPRDRAGFLARECAGQPAVRARVEALLEAHAAAGEFLRSPGSGEQPGQTIDRYRLLQLLGEGGFGSVWMAEQREPVKRRVALKVVKLGMDTKQVIARFEAERQALALMEHPNIARVFDAGATSTGRPYFVMELVRGVSIVEYCDTAKLDMAARLSLFMQVCHAIQHAHQKGIIHRDIKPSNVLVTLHDGVPVPKVIDFGIAKATQVELTARTLFTGHRQMIGTPAYMSPEQAELSGLDIDTRADVYSLGVLLYELLTGTTPFDVKQLLEQGLAEMMRVIREVEPHKPSTRVSTLGERALRTAEQRHVDVRRLGPSLRGDLDWIVMKCLEKDRGRRYESASSLAADVARHLSHEPVIAGPPSRSYRVRKFVRRNRATVAAGGAIALALVLGIAGTTIGMLRAIDAEGRANAAAESEHARADELDRVASFQSAQMATVDAARMGEGIEADLVRELGEVLRRDGLPVDEASARAGEFGRMLERVNMTNVALRALDEHVLQSAIRAVEPAFVDRPDMQAHMLTRLAITLGHLGLHEPALAPLRRALAICREHLGDDHEYTGRVQNSLAIQLQSLGRHAEAEPLMRAAVETARRHLPEDDADRLTVEYSWATVLTDLHRHEEAEAAYRSTLARCRRTLGDGHDLTTKVQNGLGTLLYELLRPAEAEACFRSALAVLRERLGHEHAESIAALGNLAMALHAQGKDGEAEPLAQEAADVGRHALGDDHAFTLVAIHTLYSIALERGRVQEAEPLIREVAERRMRALGAAHPHTRQAVDQLAAIYRSQGRLPEAMRLADEWLDLARAEGATHLDYFDGVLAHLGKMRMDVGELAAAETALRECLELRAARTPGSFLYWNAHSLLGEALARQGRHEEADPLLVDGFEKLEPPQGLRVRKLEALERVIAHYEAWGKPERAAAFRAQLDGVRAEVERGN